MGMKRNFSYIIYIYYEQKRSENRALRNTRKNFSCERRRTVNNYELKSITKITMKPTKKSRMDVEGGKGVKKRTMWDRIKGFVKIKEDSTDRFRGVK